MSEDSIFREVDEALRQEQFKKLWDKYGVYVIAAALLIVAGVAGHRGWLYWQAKQAADAGTRFVGALQLEAEGKAGEAEAALRDLANGGPSGYRILARFQLAAAKAEAGDKAAAVAAYEALVGDRGVGDLLRKYARIQAAKLRVDEADLAEMSQRLEPLGSASSPWRFSAWELLGLAAYRTGASEQAERYFNRILTDVDAPTNLRRRAEMMLALIVKVDAGSAAK